MQQIYVAPSVPIDDISELESKQQTPSRWHILLKYFDQLFNTQSPEERKKFLILCSMMALVLMIYTMNRCLKDGLVIAAPGGSSEIIASVKIFGVLPFSIIFVLWNTWLNIKIENKTKIYYILAGVFFVFFATFGFVIFPLRDFLHPAQETVHHWISIVPVLRFILPIFGIWSYVLFYIMTEMWGSVAISILFWQAANAISPISQAKRFYPLFGLLGNLGLLIGGGIVSFLMQSNPEEVGLTLGAEFQTPFMLITLLVCASILLLVYLYNKLQHYKNDVLLDVGIKKDKKPKIKLGMKESLKLLVKDPYLGYLALTVLAYGITVNLVEIQWKSSVKEYTKNPIAFTHFMGKFFSYTSIATGFVTIFTKNFIRDFGWRISSLITPIMMLFTGTIFYYLCLFGKGEPGALSIALGVTPLFFAVMVGAIQNIASKATKYTLFDATKEIAFLPLDDNKKINGKAAIDVIGNRLGKSGGSAMQYALLQIFAIFALPGTIISMGDIAIYSGIIFMLVCGAWVFCAIKLADKYETLTEEGEVSYLSKKEKRALQMALMVVDKSSLLTIEEKKHAEESMHIVIRGQRESKHYIDHAVKILSQEHVSQDQLDRLKEALNAATLRQQVNCVPIILTDGGDEGDNEWVLEPEENCINQEKEEKNINQ